MRRSTVLSLPLQLAFLAHTHTHTHTHTHIHTLITLSIDIYRMKCVLWGYVKSPLQPCKSKRHGRPWTLQKSIQSTMMLQFFVIWCLCECDFRDFWLKTTCPTNISPIMLFRRKKPMDILQLVERNLGLVFNSRSGCMCARHLFCYDAKQPNLKLKTRSKQLVGSLPIAFALPD